MTRSLIIDALCLQIAWFAGALLHDQAFPWIVILLVIQLAVSSNVSKLLVPALVVTVAGLALETAMITSGLITYSSAYTMPLWLPVLWAIFALALSNSLSWMSRLSLAPQAFLGAAFGSLSYQGAASFKVLELFSDRVTSGLILFVIWAVALPLMIYLRNAATKEVN